MRDFTRIRKPRKTAGKWVAHCAQCDHLMHGGDFDTIRLNVRLHRAWRHQPYWPLPRRTPSVALWAQAPLSLLRRL